MSRRTRRTFVGCLKIAKSFVNMLFRSLYSVVALIAVFCSTARAFPASDSVTNALSQIPACGITCIVENAPLIGCTLLDIECQCKSKNSTAILQPCLLKHCTMDQTFDIIRVQATICDRPHDSYTNTFKITAWVTGIIPIIAVSMRFASRLLGGNTLWWDDWLHLASAILVIPMTVGLLINAEIGIGKHLWDLSYDRLMAIGRWLYIYTLFWGFELLILKFSILCLYLRIFPNLWLKRAVFAFMVFTASFAVPLLGLAAFQCIPVRAIWDLEAAKTAKCINWIAVLNLTVVYEIIAEIVLFSLPIPIVLKLQMKPAKKVQLCIFFGLGVIVIAVSIARIPFLKGVIDRSDQTYTVTGASVLGFAASGVGHVCAAVPTVRALFRYVFNGFKHKTETGSSYTQGGSYETGSKRSYKSLKDSKNVSNISHQSSKIPGEARDPYRLSAIADAEDCDHSVELQPVKNFGSKSQSDGCRAATTTREISGPELKDSASEEAVLVEGHYPR